VDILASDKRNPKRKQNYDALRKAGFTPVEANRIKGASAETVANAIRSKQLPEKNIKKITYGEHAPKTSKGYRPPKPPKPRRGLVHHARTVPYITLEEYRDSGDYNFKNYLSNYSFIVSYRERKSDELHYITISSQHDLYKHEVIEGARAWIEGDKSKYNYKKILLSSLKVEYCVVKE